MRVLLTGNNGYIGPVMTQMLKQHGHRVIGLDVNFFKDCTFFKNTGLPDKQIVRDIREISDQDLEGIDAIIHLAGLSNDPLGEINPALTQDINYLATVRLARLAKTQGIKKFIFASSCSIYGIAENDTPLTEKSEINPITAYAKAKSDVEKALADLSDTDFHTVILRNATVYGVSPHLRLDLVVNNLTAWAFLTGEITIMSDGTPWRPIVHIEDFSQAFIKALEICGKESCCEHFNVGINEENYRVREIAQHVKNIMPQCSIKILNNTGADERTYRVDFSKIKKMTDFKPRWNLKEGIEELYKAFKKYNLTLKDFESINYFRVRTLKHLLQTSRINRDFHWSNHV